MPQIYFADWKNIFNFAIHPSGREIPEETRKAYYFLYPLGKIAKSFTTGDKEG